MTNNTTSLYDDLAAYVPNGDDDGYGGVFGDFAIIARQEDLYPVWVYGNAYDLPTQVIDHALGAFDLPYDDMRKLYSTALQHVASVDDGLTLFWGDNNPERQAPDWAKPFGDVAVCIDGLALTAAIWVKRQHIELAKALVGPARLAAADPLKVTACAYRMLAAVTQYKYRRPGNVQLPIYANK